MIVTGTTNNEMERYIVPAGTHPAICVGVIDCGTQHWEYMGEAKSGKKVRLQWELPGEETWTDADGVEHARTISHEYTANLHEKSNLRSKCLVSWRGRDFTEEELAGWDLVNVLGKPCMLSIVHKEKSMGGSYARVDGVMKIAKGMTVPDKAISPLVSYEVEHGDNDVFRTFPEWIRNIITSCDEWKADPEAKKAVEKAAKALEGKVVDPPETEEVPF